MAQTDEHVERIERRNSEPFTKNEVLIAVVRGSTGIAEQADALRQQAVARRRLGVAARLDQPR